MTVIVYHTPQVATPINDRRGGTYRIGSDNVNPIIIYRGWDALLNFAFRDQNQRPFMVTGRQAVARIYNNENVQVLSGNLIADPLTDGAATLILGANATNTLNFGLYSMVIEYQDDHSRTLLAKTSRSLPRFVVQVIDQTTVELNI